MDNRTRKSARSNQGTATWVIAADIGGTFTDIVAKQSDGRTVAAKLLSSAEDLSQAVVEGISQLADTCGFDFRHVDTLIHACTVATNAILEKKGAKTALLTTTGFRDVLELRRTRVPRLYDPCYVKPVPLVPRHLRLEVEERIGAGGDILRPLDVKSLDPLIEILRRESVDAVAICFLHAHTNAEHEQKAGEYVRECLPACYVSLSSAILPEIKEYERTSTTVINSYIGPKVARYVASLETCLAQRGFSGKVQIMQSSGGIIGARVAIDQPSQIVECGPAAGVVGAAKLATRSRHGTNLITFDMGGTTAKASIIEDGSICLTDEYEVGAELSTSSRLVKGNGYALKVPAIDISEIGAGGGSIVRIDEARHIKVGPDSSGSSPGPCCYGLGGEVATLTDANVVLGYLNPKHLAGGSVRIDSEKSFDCLRKQVAEPMGLEVKEAAFAVHQIANVAMTKAIKAVSTYRGRDPRDFVLFAFGGNGGVHGASMARGLMMGKIVVPPSSGVFSSVGLLLADISASQSQAFRCYTDDVDFEKLERVFNELERRAEIQIGERGSKLHIARKVDVRFAGQAFELPVEVRDAVLNNAVLRELEMDFQREHARSYGHIPEGSRRFEIVKVTVIASRKRQDCSAPVVQQRHEEAEAGGWRSAYFGPDYGELSTPILARSALSVDEMKGPVIIEEYDATTVVPPYAAVSIDNLQDIVIRLTE